VTLAAIPFTTPYAAVVDANTDALVPALNAGCQQNPRVRAAVERWSSGAGGVWALQLAAVGVNMSVQAVQLMRDPALREQATAATRAKFRTFLQAQGVNIGEQATAEAEHAPAAA
jgi:hypothetical protein